MTRRLRVQTSRAVAAILVVALAGCGPRTSETPDVDTAPSPRGTAAPASDPGLVALIDDAVVELDPDTGRTTQRHPVDPGGGLADLELVGARGVALVTRRTADGRDEVVEVDLRDGATRVLVEGAHPAATSDGQRLVFTRRVGEHEQLELVVATWDGAEEAVWPAAESGPESLAVESLSWAPGGEEVAFMLHASTGDEVRVLPVARTGTIRGASEVVPPTSSGARFVAPVFRSPGVVTLAEGCCEHDGYARWRIVDVTLGSGSVSQVAAGIEERVAHLDWQPGLGHLAITLEQPPTVVGWSHRGMTDLADGVASAEW